MGIEARHPDQFLMDLYEVDPDTVASRLHEQAATIGRSLQDLLNTLRAGVPNFAGRLPREKTAGSKLQPGFLDSAGIHAGPDPVAAGVVEVQVARHFFDHVERRRVCSPSQMP